MLLIIIVIFFVPYSNVTNKNLKKTAGWTVKNIVLIKYLTTGREKSESALLFSYDIIGSTLYSSVLFLTKI